MLDRENEEIAALQRALAEATASAESGRVVEAQLKARQQAILANEALFSIVFDNVTDAIFFLAVEPNDAFRFLAVNAAFTQITGVPSEKVIGRDVREIIPEPSLTMVLDHYRRAIAEKVTVRWDETSEYPNGTKYGEVCVTPYFDASGACRGLIGVVRDVTERRRAEALSQRHLERLEKAQRIAHMGFLDWDLRTDNLTCSDEVYRWFGVAPDEAPKTPDFVARCVHPEDLELTRTALESAVRGEKDYDLDHRVVRPDGHVLWVHAQAELVRDAAGRPERLLGIMVDITERKLAEERAREANAELERRVAQRTSQLQSVNDELASFSYSVSHDLRAPLRHINGYIDLLGRETKGQLSAKGERYLQVISNASREMGQLIDDLLTFSRMGRAEMEERVCNLDSLVRTTLAELGPTMRGRQIEWVIADLPEVIGDGSMLKLVFTNLLENAIKFTRPRETARIEVGIAGRDDGRDVFFVRDNGVGFDMQYVDNLFAVFQRLHRADQFEGTGIGLANVRRIISRHGGRTWAEAAPDRGATFYFTLRPATANGRQGHS